MPKTDSSAGRPRRSYQKLTERLRQFMEEGHFRDGDKLPPERALAESFGVSRSSVREAIRALAEKGLLESRQGDGTYVRVPDIEPLKEAILEAVDSGGPDVRRGDGIPPHRGAGHRKSLPCAIHPNSLTASRSSPAINSAACSSARTTASPTPDSTSPRRMHGQQTAIDTVARLNRIYAKGAHPGAGDTPWR